MDEAALSASHCFKTRSSTCSDFIDVITLFYYCDGNIHTSFMPIVRVIEGQNAMEASWVLILIAHIVILVQLKCICR